MDLEPNDLKPAISEEKSDIEDALLNYHGKQLPGLTAHDPSLMDVYNESKARAEAKDLQQALLNDCASAKTAPKAKDPVPAVPSGFLIEDDFATKRP